MDQRIDLTRFVVDATMMPENATTMCPSIIETQLHHMPRPVVVDALDATSLNLLTPPRSICSKNDTLRKDTETVVSLFSDPGVPYVGFPREHPGRGYNDYKIDAFIKVTTRKQHHSRSSELCFHRQPRHSNSYLDGSPASRADKFHASPQPRRRMTRCIAEDEHERVPRPTTRCLRA
jgi:hypothetical protein